MTGLFYAHSGLRFLVLLAGLAALLYYAYARATTRPIDRASRVVGAVYSGLLDLQIVLGILTVVTGIYYPALIGHIVMMVMAAAVVHGSAVLAKNTPDVKRYHSVRLAGVLVSLVFIAGGIMAIGRGVFSSGAPSVVG